MVLLVWSRISVPKYTFRLKLRRIHSAELQKYDPNINFGPEIPEYTLKKRTHPRPVFRRFGICSQIRPRLLGIMADVRKRIICGSVFRQHWLNWTDILVLYKNLAVDTQSCEQFPKLFFFSSSFNRQIAKSNCFFATSNDPLNVCLCTESQHLASRHTGGKDIYMILESALMLCPSWIAFYHPHVWF